VRAATGLDDDQMHSDIYEYFSRASAWTVTEGAVGALRQLRDAGESLIVADCCTVFEATFGQEGGGGFRSSPRWLSEEKLTFHGSSRLDMHGSQCLIFRLCFRLT